MLKALAFVCLTCFSWTAFGQVDFQANLTSGCSPLGVSIEVVSPASADITSYSWTITAPDGSVETSNASIYVAIFSETGTYDVSLTVNGTDNLTIDNYIEVFESPVANYVVDDAEGCFPHCVTFTDLSAGGSPIIEWVWDFGNGITSNEANPSFCYDLVGTYTPVLSVENATGCFDDISFPGLIEVSDQFPEVVFQPDAFLNCEPPATVTFGNSSTGATALTFDWDFGDGFTETTFDDSDLSHDFGAIGVYDVCLLATDAIGCETTACQQIEIFDSADATFTASPALICENETVSFEGSTFPQPILVEWDFDGDGVFDSSGDIASHVYTTAGLYTVEMLAYYTDDCQDSEFITIEVLPGIQAAFDMDTTYSCQVPFDVSFTNTSVEFGVTDYEWFVDGVSAGNTEDLDYNFTDFGAYAIELVIQNEFGCSSTFDTASPVLIQEPTVSFSSSSTVCTGESVPIVGIVVETLDPVAIWEWDFDDDGLPDDLTDDPDFSYDASGDYSISVDIWTEQGCYGTNANETYITIQDAVQPEFTVSDTLVCAEDEVTFCIPYQPGVTHSWNWGDGSGWDTYNYWDTCVTHSYVDTGWVDITISIWNGGCNHFGLVDSVLYINPPISEFDVIHNCADPMTVSFLSQSIGADSLYWDFGDGSPLLYNDPNPSHTFATEGDFSVLLWVYNNEAECSDDRSRTVRVYMPNPNVTLSPDEGCPPLEVSFTEEISLNTYWDVDFGNGITMEAIENGSVWDITLVDNGDTTEYSQGGANWWPDIIYNELGTFDISITTWNEHGCAGDTVMNDVVSVASNPGFADFTIDYIDTCDEIVVTVDPAEDDLADWDWQFSDGATSLLIAPTHTFAEPYSPTMSVTMNATDQVGCTASSTVTLDIVLPPLPSFEVANDPSCQGEEIQLTNTSVGEIIAYSWDFGNPADLNNTSAEENPLHSYDENGSFQICLTAENSVGCVQTACQENVVNVVNPIADFTIDADINNCLFGVQFESSSTGEVVTTEWDFGDSQIGIGEQVFHTYSIGVYDVELVVENSFGCLDTLFVPDILGYGDVIGPFNLELDTVNCAPFEADFEAFNVNDTEFTYFWDFGDGFGNPGGSTITDHLYETPGEYCPSLIMTDANGCPVLIECENSFTVLPLTLDLPEISPFCSGDSLLFAPGGASTYSWSSTEDITDNGDGTWYIHPLDTEVLTLTGQLSDCVADTLIEIPVLPLPELTLAMVDEVCFQDDVIVLDGGTPLGATGSYTIDDVPAVAFDPGMSPGITYTVTYNYTDDLGCSNSIDHEVMVHPLPEVNLLNFEEFCEDDAIITLGGGSPAGGLYYIEGTEAVTLDPGSAYGEFSVEYVFVDGNGCVNQDAETIAVNALPVVEFTLDDACFDGVLQFSNTSFVPDGLIANVDWDFGILGGSTSYDPGDIGVISSGTYDVNLEIVSASGCTSALNQSFDISPIPNVLFELDPGCEEDYFNFIDQSWVEEGEITDWEWTIDGIGSYGTDTFGMNINDWGVYDVSLSVTTAEGCENTLMLPLQVYPIPEVDFFSLGLCAGESISFYDESSAIGSDLTSFMWDFGDSESGEGIEVDHIYTSGGTYDVELTVESEFGCANSFQQQVEIAYSPDIDFSSSLGSFCAFGETAFLDLSSVEGGAEVVLWQWWVEDELYSQDSEFVFEANEPGNYDVELIVTSSAGCTDSLLIPSAVEVYPVPHADFSHSPLDADVFWPHVEFYDHSSGASEWFYDFGDGTFGTEANMDHVYPEIGDYWVIQTVTNEFGCQDTSMAQVFIHANPTLWVPNAFSPNFDGLNEEWSISLYGFDVESFQMQVFDRWGGIIFQTTDPYFTWDGYSERTGELMPEGLYNWRAVYKVASDSSQGEETGHLTIVR